MAWMAYSCETVSRKQKFVEGFQVAKPKEEWELQFSRETRLIKIHTTEGENKTTTTTKPTTQQQVNCMEENDS